MSHLSVRLLSLGDSMSVTHPVFEEFLTEVKSAGLAVRGLTSRPGHPSELRVALARMIGTPGRLVTDETPTVLFGIDDSDAVLTIGMGIAVRFEEEKWYIGSSLYRLGTNPDEYSKVFPDRLTAMDFIRLYFFSDVRIEGYTE